MIGAEDETARFERLRRKKDGLAGLLSVMQEMEVAVDSYDMPRFLEDLQRCEKAVKRLKDSEVVHEEPVSPEMPPTLREAALVKEIEGLLKQAELLNAKTVRQVEENMKFCLSETKRLRRSAKGMYYMKSGFGFPMVEFDKSV